MASDIEENTGLYIMRIKMDHLKWAKYIRAHYYDHLKWAKYIRAHYYDHLKKKNNRSLSLCPSNAILDLRLYNHSGEKQSD